MMLLEIIIYTFLGILLGVLLGLLPGFHLNNMIPFLLFLATMVDSHYYVVTLIVAMAISQVLTSFIPSVYLSAPDGDNNSLSILPGHKLLLEGRGYEAIRLTLIGGLSGLAISIAVILLFGSHFASLYNITRPYIAHALILVTIFMIISEKFLKRMIFSLVIIILSGLLGILVLNSSIVPQQNALLPTFAGLFAISTLIASIAEKTKIPMQTLDEGIHVSKINLAKSIIFGVIAGILAGLLPAIGVSQAATFMQFVGGLGEARTFLVTLSGINTANEVISLSSIYLISNPRSGASVAIERIMPTIGFHDLLLFIGVMLFAAGITVPITLSLARTIPKYLSKFSYTSISISVLVFLFFMIITVTGLYGLLIAFTSTAIGLSCAYLGVKRSNCMAVLIIPTVFYFLGLNPLILTILNI